MRSSAGLSRVASHSLLLLRAYTNNTYAISVNIKLMKELSVPLCSVFFRFDHLKSKLESNLTVK